MKTLCRVGSFICSLCTLLVVCQQASNQRRDRELLIRQQEIIAHIPKPIQVVYTPPPLEWLDLPVLITAYTPYDALDADHWSTKDFVTATNKDWRVYPYGVATDPKALPFGTRVVIPGYMDVSYPQESWSVDDTGGRMRKNWRERDIIHLDLRYQTQASAREWAPGWHTVWVHTKNLPAEKIRELLDYRQRRQACLL